VQGEAYSIWTDFRVWIAFAMMLLDDDVTDLEKLSLMLGWYKAEIPQDAQAAVEALLTFFNGGSEPSPGTRGDGKRVYDYAQDAELIYAAFRQAYGINLAVEQLHWWEFKALMSGIPETTRLASVMGIRAADTSSMGAAEKKHYARLKALYALNREQKPQTAAERDAAMIARARARRKAVEK
jgi:hypothetical protein